MKFSSIIRILLLLVLIAIIVIVGIEYRDQITLVEIQHSIQRYGIWAPIIFILLYMLATVSFLPGLVITLAGGLLFGAFWGTLYNIIGAVLGSTCAFLISRYIASDWVAAKVGGKLKKLVDGVNSQGWRFIAIVRLVPLIPFNLLNYALGLTKIPVWHYVWASVVFMLPGTIAYTYVGSLGEAFINGGGKTLVTKVAIGVGLLVIVALIPWALKKFRNKPV